MSPMLPEGQSLRQAVQWISEQLKAIPETAPQKFVSEAINKYDLSPKDADFLVNFYKKTKE